ncbi:MAG TPA: hypothetical protein IAB58_02700 [Candidatus Pelethosoma merdigallinarum]|nr:hypothetical protein [Candidatus Pelethosoma merdigallinarum]
MEEKNKEKQPNKIVSGWRKFKEIWSNPRGRALILLGIYGIFIVFVVSGVRSNVKNRDRYQEQQTNQEPEVSEPTKKYSDLDNYEYDLVITRDTNVLTYQGKHADEVDLFIDPSTNQAYYLEQSVLYQVVNGVKQPVATPIQEIDITKLTPTMIQTLLDESTLDYTKQYASGIEEKQYILSLPAFMNLFYGSTISSNEIVTITTSMNGDIMEKVTIDLSGYSRYSEFGFTTFTIEFTYKNIDKVESFYID